MQTAYKLQGNYASLFGEEITYVVGINEPIHPDLHIALRMQEVAISDCEYGCKIYADPRSRVRVLAHMRSYGCKVES